MGKNFDRHGRMNWSETPSGLSTERCPRCGAKAQNMVDHNALFHPEYHPHRKEPPTVPAKDQTKLFTDSTLDEGDERSA